MTPRASRLLELALALRQARAQASRLEAELGELVERPQRMRVSRLGGSGTPAAEERASPPVPPPPAEVADVPGLPERPLRRTEELPPLEAPTPSSRGAFRRSQDGSFARCTRCDQVGHYARGCPEATPPARLDDLRRQIAGGAYVPFADLRRRLG